MSKFLRYVGGFVLLHLTFPVVPALCLEAQSSRPELVVQSGHAERISNFTFTPDNKYVITGSADATARLWDFASGKEIRTFRGIPGQVEALDVSPDGEMLAVASGRFPRGAITFYSIRSGKKIRSFKRPVRALFFTGDGDGLIVAGSDYLAKLSASTGDVVWSTSEEEMDVKAVALAPDGRFALSGGDDQAVSQWDLATGRRVRIYRQSHDVQSIAVSPDGQSFACEIGEYGEGNTIQLWMLSAQRKGRSIRGASSPVFSPDGKRLLTRDKYNLQVWSAKSSRKLLSWEAINENVPLAFTRDGKHVITTVEHSGNNLVVWDAQTGKEMRKIGWKGGDTLTGRASVSADGKWLGVSSYYTQIWDLMRGVKLPDQTSTGEHYFAVWSAVSPDRKYVVGSTGLGKFAIKDLAAGTIIPNLGTLHDKKIYRISPDSKHVVVVQSSPVLYELATGRKIREFQAPPEGVTAVAISPDSETLAVGGNKGRLLLQSMQSGAVLREVNFGEDVADILSLAFTWDGSHLISGHAYSVEAADNLQQTSFGKIRVLNLASGAVVRTIKGHANRVRSLAVSPDGKSAASASDDGTARLWDIASGAQLRVFRSLVGGPTSVSFTADGKFLITSFTDNTVRIWDVSSGGEVCRLIGLNVVHHHHKSPDKKSYRVEKKMDWVVVTPDGYLDGSPGGLRDIRWTVGMRSYPLEAFYEGYYTPGLLARLLKGERFGSAGQKSIAEGFAPPPNVRIIAPQIGAKLTGETVEVKVAAEDQGGGVDEIVLYHNGKAVSGVGRDIAVRAKAGAAARKFSVRLTAGENRLRAAAFSRDRIESEPHEVTVSYAGAELAAALHVLTVGINKHKNPALDLNYARPDAEGVIDFFTANQGGLFREVSRHELFDSAATKPSILQRLDSLRSVPPQDVVVIYLAGHGETLGGEWFFVPHELVYPDKEADLKTKALSSTELRKRITSIGAKKVLLLLDSCKSGGVMLAFAARGFEEQKALRQLARASGVHVVAASSKDQIAAEVKELGHGIFTHTLLKALNGDADGSPNDGIVTVRELLGYIESTIPEVSLKYKAQAQYP
ncbi:MAG: caspase family protein, partial [Elusimicrobiota bacterium]